MRQPSVPEKLESMVEALRDRGMSFRDIGREAGVSRTTIWRISIGDSRMPSFDVGNRIEVLYRQRLGISG